MRAENNNIDLTTTDDVKNAVLPKESLKSDPSDP